MGNNVDTDPENYPPFSKIELKYKTIKNDEKKKEQELEKVKDLFNKYGEITYCKFVNNENNQQQKKKLEETNNKNQKLEEKNNNNNQQEKEEKEEEENEKENNEEEKIILIKYEKASSAALVIEILQGKMMLDDQIKGFEIKIADYIGLDNKISKKV